MKVFLLIVLAIFSGFVDHHYNIQPFTFKSALIFFPSFFMGMVAERILTGLGV